MRLHADVSGYCMNMKLLFLLFILPFSIFAQSGESKINEFIVTFGGNQFGPIQKEKVIAVDSLELFINSNFKASDSRIVGFAISMSGLDITLKSYSNKLTQEQKDLLRKLPIFTRFYIEDINISYNNKIIKWGTIRYEISGYSCSIQRRIINYRDCDNELLNRNSKVTIKELISNNELLVQWPNGKNSYCDIDTNIIISEYSCEIAKYSTEIDENGVEQWVSDISSDSTYVIAGKKIPNELKVAFSGLRDHDLVRFYNIKAANRDGIIIEVAPLYLEIIE